MESEQLLRQQSQQVITKLEMSVDELKAELDRERNARKLAEQENVKMKAKMDQMANDNFKMSQELSGTCISVSLNESFMNDTVLTLAPRSTA